MTRDKYEDMAYEEGYIAACDKIFGLLWNHPEVRVRVLNDLANSMGLSPEARAKYKLSAVPASTNQKGDH